MGGMLVDEDQVPARAADDIGAAELADDFQIAETGKGGFRDRGWAKGRFRDGRRDMGLALLLVKRWRQRGRIVCGWFLGRGRFHAAGAVKFPAARGFKEIPVLFGQGSGLEFIARCRLGHGGSRFIFTGRFYGPQLAFMTAQGRGHTVLDGGMDGARVRKADFMLGGMDIDVHLVVGQLDEQYGQWKTAFHQAAVIAFRQCMLDHPVAHAPSVDKYIGAAVGGAGQLRRADMAFDGNIPFDEYPRQPVAARCFGPVSGRRVGRHRRCPAIGGRFCRCGSV